MFYIDIDLNSNMIFIFPVVQDKHNRYLISVKARYEADNIINKLKAGTYKEPPESNDFRAYDIIKLGDVTFQEYRLVTQ